MNYRRTVQMGIITLIVAMMAVSPVLAAKPIDVQYQSNGFPSGQHFNLNLHGRDPSTYTGTPTGNTVIVALNGSSTIEYLSNKRNLNNTELVVLDALAENFGPDYDPAQVYLPYNIVDESDNVTKPAGGYYVYGRILGSPNKGSDGGPSTILITQNFIVAAANSANSSTDEWPFGFDPDADLLGLGVVTTEGNLYVPSIDGTFKRFDPPTDPYEPGNGNKQGKSKAVEITELFKWTGYVSDNLSLDFNGNGYLDIGDVPADWELIYGNGDGSVSDAEFQAWLDYLVSIGEAVKHEGVWIFDIADMVISGQTVINDGTKNFQIRFYPVATTVFGDPR